MCRLLIYLSFISGYLPAQVIETKVKESADSTYQPPASPSVVPFKHPGDSLSQTIQTRACVYLFNGQTVSFLEIVTGCSTLTVQNITVISSGDLYLSAPGDITISDAFDVNLGGQLNVNTSPPPTPQFQFNYTYDASGNRINRTLVP